jgi:acetoacetyl-CoA synthetase
MGDATSANDVELWRRADPSSTRMWEFLLLVNEKYGLKMQSYHDLYKWSIDNIPQFWEEIWHFCGIKADKPFDKVIRIFLGARDEF